MAVDSDQLLARSYKYCREVARKRARNFYYSFMVLPREKSDAMCAVYAFMRFCDDIADDPSFDGDRRQMLERWRGTLGETLDGEYGDSLVLPAFHDTLRKYEIPAQYFHDLIDGAAMDLSIERYATFRDLYKYCYRVASVVGLVCIHIYGFTSPDAKKYAEYCGIAFQLTNILRDVKEDAVGGRVYIPEEDLVSFNYTLDDLQKGVMDDRYYSLMKFEVKRARSYYNASQPLVDLIDESSRPALRAMIEIYSGILERIEKSNYDVFSRRISLPTARKLSIAGRAFLRARFDR